MKGPGRFFILLIAAGGMLFIAAQLVMAFLLPSDISIKRVEFRNQSGDRLVGDLYLPKPADSPRPGVLLCHGVEVSKEIMTALGVESARRGLPALAFDYGGYGESDDHRNELALMVDDTRSALEYLRELPETRDDEFILIGHSMGVHYSATLAADEPTIKAVVGMGNNHANPNVPPNNLALFMGVYEEFHTLHDMLAAARESARDERLLPNQIAGDFSRGSARALIVSPYSEHGIEPMDPYLIKKAFEWIDRALIDYKVPSLSVQEPYRLMASAILVFSGAAVILGCQVLALVPAIIRNQGRMPRLRSRFYLLILVIIFAAGNFAGPRAALHFSDIVIALVLGGSIGAALAAVAGSESNLNAAFLNGRNFFLYGLGVILIGIVIYIFSIFAVGLPQAYSLNYLRGIPGFFLHTVPLLVYEGLSLIRVIIFYRYSEALIPGIILGAILFFDMVRPGSATLLSAKAVMTLIRAFQIRGRIKLADSKLEIAVAVIVFAALGYFLFTRFEEGWLVKEALAPFFLISLKAMILPLILFILAMNVYHRKFGGSRGNFPWP